MAALTRPVSTLGRACFEHRLADLPADLPLVAVQLVRLAGAVPDGDGPRARAGTSSRQRGSRRRALPRVPGARACWPRPRCRPRRSRRRSRSSAGCIWNKVFHAMYATPISAARHRARATSPGSRPGCTLVAADLHAGDRRVRGVPVAAGPAVHPGRGADRAGLRRADRRVRCDPAQRRTASRNIFRFVITPLFLFSGTFFPISSAADEPPGARGGSRRSTTAWRSPARCPGHGRGRSAGHGHPPRLPRDRWPSVGAYLTIRTIERRLDRADDARSGSRPPVAIGSRRSMRLIERNLLRLPARLAGPPLGLLRAAVLPARDRLRPGGADRHDPRTRRAADHLRSSSSHRRCSPPPR